LSAIRKLARAEQPSEEKKLPPRDGPFAALASLRR
jgi:hypothetical protein